MAYRKPIPALTPHNIMKYSDSLYKHLWEDLKREIQKGIQAHDKAASSDSKAVLSCLIELQSIMQCKEKQAGLPDGKGDMV